MEQFFVSYLKDKKLIKKKSKRALDLLKVQFFNFV